MLETIQSVSLLTAMVILGPIALAIAFIYGLMRSSRRPKGAIEQKSKRATREHYQSEN